MATAKRPINKNRKPKEKTTVQVVDPVIEPVQILEPAPAAHDIIQVPEEQPLVEMTPPVPNIQRPGLLVLIDFLFWEQGVGANFPIFLTVSLLGGMYWLASNGHKPSIQSLLLIVPFLFFGMVSFSRSEPLTVFLGYTFTLLSIGLIATSYLGGRWILYDLLDYLSKPLMLLFDMLVQPVQFVLRIRKENSSGNVLGSNSPLWGLLRGLAIALPIVLCFASLLASADMVFDQKLDEFFEDISENTRRFILILLCAYFMIGVFLHAATRSEDKKLASEGPLLIKPVVGFTESTVVLASVSLLFILFVMVQFQYFFGGERNIGVAGYTYSEYARRGFNELVIVAFFSLVLILGLSSLTRRESESRRRIYSGLSILLAVLVLIILTSAYQRIELGISWHGNSRLRLYPKIFLIWLALLFVTVVVLELLRNQRYFAFAALLASFGFGASLFFTDVDNAIIQRNLYRGWHGKNLNIPHLASLSDDAIPLLATEYLYGDMPTSTRRAVGAALACYRYFEDRDHVTTHDWRSLNWSARQAQRSLEIVRPYLGGYVVRYDNWPVRVRTPDGAVYECKLRTTLDED
jgi:hypothetical protein